jgi:peptide/nickel transport system substrate-binding protein
MTKRRLRPIVATVAGLSVTILAVTFGASGAVSAPSKSGAATTLNMRISSAPPNLSPALHGQEDDPLLIMRFVYDSLVANDNGKIIPYLATKWSQPTPNSLKFWMRPGVTCSDGSKLRATDVAATVAYFSDPATHSVANTFIFNQPTATAVPNNAAGTVTITYPKPNPDGLYAIARMPVICAAGLKDPTKLNTQAFGSGPFVLTKSVPGSSYTFTKRNGYTWGPNGDTTKAAGFPARVVLQVVQNDTTASSAFQAGQLQVLYERGLEQPKVDTKKVFKTVQPVQVHLMMINQASGHPGSGANVRKGLVASLGRGALTRVFLGGNGRTANKILLPDSPCQPPAGSKNPIPPFNTSEAAKAFAAAGYTLQGGKLMKNGEQLTINAQIIQAAYGGAVADYLTSVWGAMGIKVNAVVAPGSQVIATITGTTNWDIAFSTFSTHYPSYLNSFLQGPPRPAGFNFMYVTNAQYTNFANQALAKPATTDACKLWTAAYRSVLQQLDMIPIAYADTSWYGKGVTFKVTSAMFGIFPSSLRVTQ